MRRVPIRSIWKPETRSKERFEQAGFSVVGVRFDTANVEAGRSGNENIAGEDVGSQRDVNIRLSVLAVRKAAERKYNTKKGKQFPTNNEGEGVRTMVEPIHGWAEGHLDKATFNKDIRKEKRPEGVDPGMLMGTHIELMLFMCDVDLHGEQMLKIMEVHDQAAKAIQEIVGW